MTITADDLFHLTNVKDYKLHLAVWNYEEQPLDVFVRSREDWISWNSWRRGRDDFSRPFIFSLIRFYPLERKWLFGGIFEVTARDPNGNTVQAVDAYEKFTGRLLFDYLGAGVRGRAFYLENHYSRLVVSQILEAAYTGEAFCGYENVDHSFSMLESIIKRSKADWKAALENVKGVYLVTDASNGKMYIGSAYGDFGLWSRWACYVETGHGWNDQLTRTIQERGLPYARENFKFSILEHYPMRTEDQLVIDREQHWKRVLQSGRFGYNSN